MAEFFDNKRKVLTPGTMPGDLAADGEFGYHSDGQWKFRQGGEVRRPGGATVDIQTFTSDGTWTKPKGASRVEVWALGGGGGGGSGRKGAESTVRTAGGAGSAGALMMIELPASVLGATEPVVVGAGGAGGSGAPGVVVVLTYF